LTNLRAYNPQLAEPERQMTVKPMRASRPGDDGVELNLGGLGDLLGFHLRLASAAMHRDFLAVLADQDVTPKQVALLWLIETNPGVSQISIAQALDMDRATTMAIIDRLEARGLALRRRSTVDRRRQELYLTDQGLVFLAQAKALSQEHDRKFTERLTPEEKTALRSTLGRLHRG
jgi:DNA-binding MarR family transcriptional regulator